LTICAGNIYSCQQSDCVVLQHECEFFDGSLNLSAGELTVAAVSLADGIILNNLDFLLAAPPGEARKFSVLN
jgi:hypothetical protein